MIDPAAAFCAEDDGDNDEYVWQAMQDAREKVLMYKKKGDLYR